MVIPFALPFFIHVSRIQKRRDCHCPCRRDHQRARCPTHLIDRKQQHHTSPYRIPPDHGRASSIIPSTMTETSSFMELDTRTTLDVEIEAMYSPDRAPTSLPSHGTRPRPGRRRPSRMLACHRHTIPLTILYSTLLLLSLLCSTVTAAGIGGREGRRSTLAQLARRGEILVDRRPAPRVKVQRRQLDDPSLLSTISVPTSTASDEQATTTVTLPTSTVVAPSDRDSTVTSSTTSLMTVASSAPYSPLPSPFDTSLGNNFTNAGCPAFFQTFLSNSTFKSCLPFSLLLQV